jgi:hypothetical protein
MKYDKTRLQVAYGLTNAEAIAFACDSDCERFEAAVETWRAANGHPAQTSPLVRGYLLDLLAGKERLT